MEIFLSWSESESKAIAILLKDWLETVVQQAEIFISDEIGKGKFWEPELNRELSKQSSAILILTPNNLNSKFLHYEAGALAKGQAALPVCPVLFGGLKPSDIEQPLSQFQCAQFDFEDFWKVIRDCTKAAGLERKHSLFRAEYEKKWNTLHNGVTEILSKKVTPFKPRADRELLEEILDTVRQLASANSQRESATFGQMLERKKSLLDMLARPTPTENNSLLFGLGQSGLEDALKTLEARRELANSTLATLGASGERNATNKEPDK